MPVFPVVFRRKQEFLAKSFGSGSAQPQNEGNHMSCIWMKFDSEWIAALQRVDYYKLAVLWTTSYPFDNSANPNIDYLPPYFDKRPMLFSLLCPNNEKAGHRGGRETYKWCCWKRENSFFDARQSRVGPRSELMTRYNEPHAREHKDTPGWVRNHRKHTSHVHNCTRVRVWSKFATIVVVRARVQLFVSPLCHFGAWDRFNFGTIWLRAKHVIHSIGLNAPIMWDLFWA